MLPKEKQMEVLEAFDLTKSYRAAGQLTGVDHHTVARAVAARALGHGDRGGSPRRPTVAEAFCDKITEWIERSGGRVRADVVHDKLGGHGLHRLGAHHQAGGRGPEGDHRRREPPHLQALDHRAGHVAAIRLRRRAGDRGREGGAVLCLAGLEPVPGDHPARRPLAALGDRRARPDLPPDRRRAHLRADRQREDGHRPPPLRHRRAQRHGRRRLPLLRGHHRHLRALRPRVQGRLGVLGEAGQGRPGADRVQPARGLQTPSPPSKWRAPSSWPSSTPGPTRSPAGPRPRCSMWNEPSCTRCPTCPTPPPSGSPGRSGGPRSCRSGERATRCPTPWPVAWSGSGPPPARW